MERDVVWLTEFRQFAYLVEKHANYAIVEWPDEDGTLVREAVTNDEYEEWEEHAIVFDTDAD